MVQAKRPPILSEESGGYVDVAGVRTFYIKAGDGHPLVLMHGGAPGACTVVSWSPVIDRLAANGFAVYAYDQPGYGYTQPTNDHSLAFRAKHGQLFIEAIGLDRSHVAGNSQGAYIAAYAALHTPGVDKLIVMDGGTLSPPPTQTEVQEAVRRHGEKLRAYAPSLDNARQLTSGTLFSPVPEELARARYEMSSGWRFDAQKQRAGGPPPPPLYDELDRLPGKTLIIWGYNDHGDPLERGLALMDKIPGAEMHVFGQAAHWPQWDQTERFVRIVTDFLKT
jgi:pimeloyl-ACP methyl ester carboxylesterase